MRTTRTGRRPSSVRLLLRRAALGRGAAAAVLLRAQPASAHADLVRSDPPDGSVLAHAPGVARLWFSEEISPEFSSARVVDGTGTVITGSRAQAGGGDPRQLTVALPDLRTGPTVWWGECSRRATATPPAVWAGSPSGARRQPHGPSQLPRARAHPARPRRRWASCSGGLACARSPAWSDASRWPARSSAGPGLPPRRIPSPPG